VSNRAAIRRNTEPGPAARSASITKSGGNDFHGALFDYVRRDKFDSRNYFDSTRSLDGA